MSMRKRAEQSSTSVEDLLKSSNEKERLRQKMIRAVARSKRLQKEQEQVVTEGGRSSGSSEQRPQRVRQNAGEELGVSASVAERFDN